MTKNLILLFYSLDDQKLNTRISDHLNALQHLREIYLGKIGQRSQTFMIFMECLFLNASSFVFCNIGNNQIIGTIPENLPRKLETLWLGALFLDCAYSHATKEY